MKRSIGFVWLGVALSTGPAVQAQETQSATSQTTPLFSTHDVIELTLHAPFKKVFRERSQDPEQFPATLSYADAPGAEVSVDLQINTRGRFRLQKRTCNFPPIRLDLPKGDVAETIFAGQNKLKLVTHCQSGRDQYEQYVFQEYLIYRMFNLFTDRSFRVRLARLTYIDTEEESDPLTRVGFLIEDKDDMAARHGWEVLDIPVIPAEFFDPAPLAVVELFMYLIGNTDFSAFQAPEGETECCHNTKVIGTMAGPVYSVPYDFDMSGLIDTRYSQVAEGLEIRSVRQRLYRGICRPREALMEAIQPYNEHRDAIYALWNGQEGLDPKVLEETIEYLDEFYEIINDDRKIEREIEDDCRS
jgi:hypothetical protein